MRRLWNEIPRKLRFFADALLALVLLFAVYVALDCPTPGMEETRFRRAERANLVGPSRLLDRLDVPRVWVDVGYDRLLIGDDGEKILFYTYSKDQNGRYTRGTLWRREKTDGILLTPAPRTLTVWGTGRSSLEVEMVLPIFLFADDPEAARAEVSICLSETYAVTMTRERRGKNSGYFRFDLPLTSENWQRDGEILEDLSATNMSFWQTSRQYPATIRLYDASGTLLETRDYLIRSREAGND